MFGKNVGLRRRVDALLPDELPQFTYVAGNRYGDKENALVVVVDMTPQEASLVIRGRVGGLWLNARSTRRRPLYPHEDELYVVMV